MELIRSKKLLFGIVVVLLLATSVLPGCNEEPPVEAEELVIPSSLEPEEVLVEAANAGPLIQPLPYFQEGWTAEHMAPYAMPPGATGEQFLEGYYLDTSEFLYIKRDGKQAGDELYKLVLHIAVLKYEDTESAERSFVNISETEELQDSTYGGIDLKSGSCSLPSWWEEFEYWDGPTMPGYLIQTDCFVIYFYGREDVTKDMLDRIIVAFGNDSANATITTL